MVLYYTKITCILRIVTGLPIFSFIYGFPLFQNKVTQIVFLTNVFDMQDKF